MEHDVQEVMKNHEIFISEYKQLPLATRVRKHTFRTAHLLCHLTKTLNLVVPCVVQDSIQTMPTTRCNTRASLFMLSC